MRKNQLVLIENLEVDFRLDQRTKDLGRSGIAAAREALRSATEKSQHKPLEQKQAYDGPLRLQRCRLAAGLRLRLGGQPYGRGACPWHYTK